MSIKRIIAADMTTALKDIRTQLGADAVILSSRKIDEGIEVIASDDLSLQEENASSGYDRARKKMNKASADTSQPVNRQWQSDAEPSNASLRSELGGIRSLLQRCMGNLAWDDYSSKSPTQASLWERLSSMGISGELIREVLQQLDASEDIDSSWRFALGHLSRRVPVLGRDLSAGGGMFAFLGAAGVGKTTTIGKLATRYVLEHGPDAVALVTTDHYRVAAHEQLRSLGNILGVTVRVVDDNHSLSEVLLTLRNKSLVLIDTAGLNVLDPNFNKQLDMLNQNGARVQNLLLMASTSQKTVLQREYQAYSKVNLSATVITKVDDTASIGECLSLATEKQLPIAYETHGQNIPDDIAVAHGTQLVNKAVELSQRLELNREQIITEFRDSFSVENLAKQPIASFN